MNGKPIGVCYNESKVEQTVQCEAYSHNASDGDKKATKLKCLRLGKVREQSE